MAVLRPCSARRYAGNVLEFLPPTVDVENIDQGKEEPLASVGWPVGPSLGNSASGLGPPRELCGPGGVRYGIIEPRPDGTHAVRCGEDETLLIVDGVELLCGGTSVATVSFCNYGG